MLKSNLNNVKARGADHTNIHLLNRSIWSTQIYGGSSDIRGKGPGNFNLLIVAYSFIIKQLSSQWKIGGYNDKEKDLGHVRTSRKNSIENTSISHITHLADTISHTNGLRRKSLVEIHNHGPSIHKVDTIMNDMSTPHVTPDHEHIFWLPKSH